MCPHQVYDTKVQEIRSSTNLSKYSTSQPFSTIEGPKLYTYFPHWKRLDGTPNADHGFIIDVPCEIHEVQGNGQIQGSMHLPSLPLNN